MDFETVLKKVGEYGAEQKKYFYIFASLNIFIATQVIGLVFIGKEPPLRCHGKPYEEHPCLLQPSCTRYVYGKDFTSVVSEWDLVCDRAYVIGELQSYLMLGMLVGNLIFGSVSDNFGRRKTFILCLVGFALVSNLAAFAQTFFMFSLLRIAMGFLVGGVGLVAFVITTEMIGGSQRVFVGTCFQSTFSVGIMMLALLAYNIHSWRYLITVTSFPICFYVFIYWIVPESPRWLASQGRISEAEDILLFLAHKNGKPLSKSTVQLEAPAKTIASSKNYGYTDLFRTPVLRKQILIQAFTWFTCSFVYYGLTMGAGNIGGNAYISVALSGLAEIPAYVLCVLFMDRRGRKKCLCFSMFIGGLACFLLLLVPQTGSFGKVMASIFVVIGKMGITAAFNIVYIYSSELIPTVLRNSGLGFCSMSARIGGIVAPKVATLGFVTTYVLFGAASLLTGLLDLQLPETLGRTLPEVIDDVEKKSFSKHLTTKREVGKTVQAMEEKLSMLKKVQSA